MPHGLGEWHGRGGMGAGDKSSGLSSLTAWALWQELFFILSSIWQHRFYYMFGFLVLVFLVSLCLPGGGWGGWGSRAAFWHLPGWWLTADCSVRFACLPGTRVIMRHDKRHPVLPKP